jgi:hypothetical protein
MPKKTTISQPSLILMLLGLWDEFIFFFLAYAEDDEGKQNQFIEFDNNYKNANNYVQ